MTPGDLREGDTLAKVIGELIPKFDRLERLLKPIIETLPPPYRRRPAEDPD